MFLRTHKRATVISILLTLACLVVALILGTNSLPNTTRATLSGFLLLLSLIAFPIFKYLLQPRTEKTNDKKLGKLVLRSLYIAAAIVLTVLIYHFYLVAKTADTSKSDIVLTIKAHAAPRECPRLDCKIIGYYDKPTRTTLPADYDVSQVWIELTIYSDSSKTKTTKGYFTRDSFVELSDNQNTETSAINSSSKQNIQSKTIKVPDTPAIKKSGPPVDLYFKSSTNVYSCEKTTCTVLDNVPGGWVIKLDYTPTGDWLPVLSKGTTGYVQMSQLVTAANFPSHCSVPVAYNIGTIVPEFTTRWNREALLGFVQIAEKEWENALGRNLFNYDPKESNNLIQFLVDDYAAEDKEHVGIDFNYSLPNGTPVGFRITIPTRFYASLDPYKTSFASSPESTSKLEDEYMIQILTHELGHAIGLNHVDDVNAVMYKSGKPQVPHRALNQTDIAALKAFCGIN